jgi:hypothetical protein
MKTIQWLFFNAAIPLSPVGIVWFIFWLFSNSSATPPKKAQAIFSIIKDGQVFFYCTALTSGAIGDLGKVPNGFDTSPWVMVLLFIIILSTVAFAVAAYNKDALEEKKFGWCSVATAITAILTVISFRDKAGLL